MFAATEWPSGKTLSPWQGGGRQGGLRRGQEGQGRKRHILVDTLGLLVAVAVRADNCDDGTSAPLALGKIDPAEFPRLQVVYGDKKHDNKTLDRWLEAT